MSSTMRCSIATLTVEHSTTHLPVYGVREDATDGPTDAHTEEPTNGSQEEDEEGEEIDQEEGQEVSTAHLVADPGPLRPASFAGRLASAIF